MLQIGLVHSTFVTLMNSPHTFQSASWKIAIAMFFLLIYGLGTIEVAGIHDALHAEDHTEALEKDPCHRSVFHKAKDSCKHPTHFTTQKKCFLCHLIFQNDEEAANLDSISLTFLTSVDFTVDDPSTVLGISFVRCGRAPPVQA